MPETEIWIFGLANSGWTLVLNKKYEQKLKCQAQAKLAPLSYLWY